jgi:glyoxylase-like metal-dependent hydrolase (beta-lactamase superfamily II)
MGLVGELVKQGVKLLLIDVQKEFVHFSDNIFARDKLRYTPVDDTDATMISCKESRSFLSSIGIHGEIIHTPSHSEDSISLLLDNGDFFVGDLEPFEYIEAYGENDPLKNDWERILSRRPGRIFYAHMPEKRLD